MYVHTPLITGSDCEGAGEMFQVTTLDLANTPVDDQGRSITAKDFFGKETNLTVSGQLNCETYYRHSAMYIPLDLPSVQRIPIPPAMQQSSG